MQIGVVTLNVWALPEPLAKDVDTRMRAIAAALPGLDADVVAFQEVWTRSAAQRLIDGAAPAGFVALGDPAQRGGGLLLLSRLPARWLGFTPFAARGRPERVVEGDYWGRKGFARAEVTTDAGPVTAVTTHLQARYHPTGRDPNRLHRVAQAVELGLALRDLASPVILLGDLNLREGDLEYRIVRGLADLRDTGVEPGPRAATVLADNPYNGAGHEPTERIDYVMLGDAGGLALDGRETRRVFDTPLEIRGRRAAFSDHAGVQAVVTLGERAPHPMAAPAPALIDETRRHLTEGLAAAHRWRRRGRGAAGVTALAAAGGLAATPRSGIDRRGLLARLARGLALGAIPGSALLAWLLERHGRDEIAAFETLGRAIERLGGEADAASS